MRVAHPHEAPHQHKRLWLQAGGLSALSLALAACADNPLASLAGWVNLIDGRPLERWNRVGTANWRVMAEGVQADEGVGFLVSRASYTDFELRAEFWADAEADGGIFVRCQRPGRVTAGNAYKISIRDGHPDPAQATGAIAGLAGVRRRTVVAERWNTCEITARGDYLTVMLNGERTAELRDSRFAGGPIALQRTGGMLRFRKLEIRALLATSV